MTRHLILALLFGIALVARLGAATTIGLNEPPKPGSDDAEYDSYAWNLAQGRGFRGISPDMADQNHLTAYRPPATSIVWAAVYALLGHRYAAVRVLHCIVGALTVLLVYRVGNACFGWSIGVIAASLYAIWPTSLFFSAQLGSEALGTLWLMAYIAASLAFAERPSWPHAISAGLMLGAAILTRPNAALMVPLAVLWAACQFRRHPARLVRALAIPLVGLLALVPWATRNYVVFGVFIPLSTGGGDVFLGANNAVVGTNPSYYGYWIWPAEIPEYRDALRAPNNEVERDRVAMRLALEWLKGNPDKWWYLTHSRVQRAFTPFLQQESPRLYRFTMLWSWGPVLLLMTLAFCPTLISLLRREHPGWLVHLGIIHFIAVTVIFWGNSRFRYPIEGLCIILATTTVVWIARWCGLVGSAAADLPSPR
jgi:4-amino-4-deoxy-L-arabinose transferase-like glycosyltransferase